MLTAAEGCLGGWLCGKCGGLEGKEDALGQRRRLTPRIGRIDRSPAAYQAATQAQANT